MGEEQEQNGIDAEDSCGGYSFPIFTMWLIYGVLLVVIAQVSLVWGRLLLHGIYLFVLALFIQTAFSQKILAKTQEVDETMTAATWKFNNLLFFVVIPLLVWGGLMTMRGWRF